MRNFARNFTRALFIGTLIVFAPVSLLAQMQAEHSDHETLNYNEEVVKKLLQESDPDVAFLARVKMMQGHLSAAVYAVGKGDMAEAKRHIVHPVSEILPDIVRVLNERKLEDPTPALKVVLDLLQDGTTEEIQAALYDAIVEIEILEYSIDPSKMVIDRIVADAAVLLLRTAVMEYVEAFKNGEIVNVVEYHDGAAFVTEAATVILDAKYEWSTRNPAAFTELELSLKELQMAWPSDIPPANAVIPLNRMLALVTIIGEQIEKIRAGA